MMTQFKNIGLKIFSAKKFLQFVFTVVSNFKFQRNELLISEYNAINGS
jgi:hypothetical protein